MIPFGPLSTQIQVLLVLSASFVFAVLKNVTVDDAVLADAVVLQYLPSDSVWAQGNNCAGCLAKPDPSKAYNGTWHDTTYSLSNNYTQVIEFTFTGSALYIFFIIANTVSFATTFIGVEFVLDGVIVDDYVHEPSSSTDYEYNVPVYVNDSLVLGQHQMKIQPVSLGSDVLILFDYLIYTVDTSSSLSSGSGTVTSSPSTLPTSSALSKFGVGSSSAALNIGAIVGGALGSAVLVIMAASLLYCHRRKGGDDDRPSGEGAVVDPLIPSCLASPTLLVGTISALSMAEVASRSKANAPSTTAVTPQPANGPASSSGGTMPTSDNYNLIEQVELLRDEVAQLRYLHDLNWSAVLLHAEAPPEYSEAE